MEIVTDEPPRPVAVQEEKLPAPVPEVKPAEDAPVVLLRKIPPEPKVKPAEPLKIVPVPEPAPVVKEPTPEKIVTPPIEAAEPPVPANGERELPPVPEAEPTEPQIVEVPVSDLPETRLAFYLHLASYRSAMEVEWGWEDLLITYPDMLEGLGLERTRVDLGSRGIFYRLSAGPLIDKLRADQICRRLEELNQFCQVRIGPRRGS
jgi:hypothetical protein